MSQTLEARRFQAPADGRIDVQMKTAFEEDGFLVLDGFAGADDIAALNGEIDGLLAKAEAPDRPTVFGDHAGDRYFLESGDQVRFFFEPGAIDEAGRPTRALSSALNKIGHNLHDRNETFDNFLRSSKFFGLADSLGQAEAVLMQSMVIFKQPDIGAAVNWHQDATFLRTEPHSVLGLWLALESADRTNGCLYAIPGGHRGPLRKWFGRVGSDLDQLDMRDMDTSPYDVDRAVALEAEEGTLVLLHGFLPHMSTANTSSRSRRALTLHVVDGTLPYEDSNWLQRQANDPARRFDSRSTNGAHQ